MTASLPFFGEVEEAPPDPILGVAAAYKADTSPEKVNLGVGAYRTESGAPYVFPSVKKAEEMLISQSLDKEYLPQQGSDPLRTAAQRLLFGDDCSAIQQQRICTTQALSGTGALRVLAEFIARCMPSIPRVCYVSDPTWGNHKQIFERAGFTVRVYPYWDPDRKDLRMDELCSCLEKAEEGAVVIFHACAHNPTGMDPTKNQWDRILKIVQSRSLLSLVDSAYQGYASGDLNEDGWLIREMVNRSTMPPFMVAQSFAKNFGLYGERIGALHLVCANKEEANKALTQLKVVIRAMYSNPPLHGARIVAAVIGDPVLRRQWEQELKSVASRIASVRSELRRGLEAAQTPGQWDHITRQIGMFSFTGLSEAVCGRLVDKYHIYLLKNGRISLAGLNSGNMEYVVRSIDESVRACGGISSSKL